MAATLCAAAVGVNAGFSEETQPVPAPQPVVEDNKEGNNAIVHRDIATVDGYALTAYDISWTQEHATIFKEQSRGFQHYKLPSFTDFFWMAESLHIFPADPNTFENGEEGEEPDDDSDISVDETSMFAHVKSDKQKIMLQTLIKLRAFINQEAEDLNRFKDEGVVPNVRTKEIIRKDGKITIIYDMSSQFDFGTFEPAGDERYHWFPYATVELLIMKMNIDNDSFPEWDNWEGNMIITANAETHKKIEECINEFRAYHRERLQQQEP
jgi:hypothetical protein